MSDGCLTRPQLRSVRCSSPSMPPRSTKAPYSVTFLTWPLTLSPFVKRFHELRALGVQLFFEQRAAADDDVAAAAIQLGDANLEFLLHQVVEVGGGTQIVLRARKERADADVDDEAALDAIDDFAGDGFFGFECGFDFFPSAAAENFLVREDDVAVFVLAGALDFDGGVGFGARNVGFGELDSRESALRSCYQRPRRRRARCRRLLLLR